MAPGIHLLHKPVGPTSFSIVQKCMTPPTPTQSKQLKICHGGTLDPFASGLLLILVEPATRLFDQLHNIPKVYEATMSWGIETDNGDPLGKVISQGDASGLIESRLDEALRSFIGWHEQIPPATSAKRIDGERAYLKAHRGEAVQMPPVNAYLHEATWLAHELPRESRVRLVVRGGYYIRALARDLGRKLGCGAHVSSLHRSAIGPWTDPGPERSIELHGREILPWLPARLLSDQEFGAVRRNQPIPIGHIEKPDWPLPAQFHEPNSPIRGFHRERLICLLHAQGHQLQLHTALRGGV
jgi:tRNA pseudouridine55 synthase